MSQEDSNVFFSGMLGLVLMLAVSWSLKGYCTSSLHSGIPSRVKEEEEAAMGDFWIQIISHNNFTCSTSTARESKKSILSTEKAGRTEES